MSSPFVWFDNIGDNRGASSEFLTDMFGWQQAEAGSMTMMLNGPDGPFAGVCDTMQGVSGWVPYIEVGDLAAATKKAQGHGAKVLTKDMVGPAGTATFISDPGGSVMALWKRAAASA